MNQILMQHALTIVKTLRKAGYVAFFAGGWVRDFLMKHPSDDIDIATNAPTDIIIQLFPQTIPVGIAFGVVIVVIHGHPFEVATFRKDIEYTNGRKPARIELSTAEEDAQRRDFTINGMFYDPITEEVLDFVNGRADLAKGIIRTIGNPHERFDEDRLRMIRAIRFATRFGFQIDKETQEAIQTHSKNLLPAVAMERIWQEFRKMAKSPGFDRAIIEMHRLFLLPTIFPTLKSMNLSDIEARVANFKFFPKQAPPILYLMELFPNMPLEELLEVCQYLKTSGDESKLIEFAHKGRILLTQENQESNLIEAHEWAHFYSNRFFKACFEAITAPYAEEQEQVIEKHAKRQERLLPHIERLVEKKPLVTAAMLKDYGILPGKQMGVLLKEAERIAIQQDLHDPDIVIQLLLKR